MPVLLQAFTVACNAKTLRMNLQTKKIIAREFLILTLTIAIGLLCFFCTYPYNYYRNNQVDNLNKKISDKTKIVDSLRYSYNKKMEKKNWFNEILVSKFDYQRDSLDKVWKRLDDLAKKDSIKFRWEKWGKEVIAVNKEIGLGTPEAFKLFIETNRIEPADIEKYNQSLNANRDLSKLITEKNEIEGKILSHKEQKSFGVKSLIFVSLLFFGLRYLFYAVRWSIKILKQKGE